MAKQILKGLTLLTSIIGLTLGFAVAANGQRSPEVIAQVPFDFIVANKDFRAGECHVRRMNDAGNALLIGSADTKTQLVTLTNDTGPTKGENTEARLVFHRYGSTYFLSQVWVAGEMSGREFQESRRERAIARELRTIASNRASTKALYDVVEVIAMVR
jgi:hypothetical protein